MLDSLLLSHLCAASAAIVAVLVTLLALLWRRNRHLERRLATDPLTGMPSLKNFFALCQNLLAQAPTQRYVLLSGDIRHFKVVNDLFGFAMGDALLQALGICAQNMLEEGECCTRISSDQFVLLLRFRSWDHLHERLRRMGEALDRWRDDRSLPYAVELAFGAYPVRRSDTRDTQLMLDLANYARLEAKRREGSPLVVYDEHMRQQALLHQELAGRLRDALARNEIQVWHQAKVDVRSGGLVGSEALARWDHPVRGLLLPKNFLPALQRHGLAADLDMYVFTQICAHLRSWQLRNLPVYPVSCNFSAALFGRPDLPQRLTAIARSHDVSPSLLEVEITEDVIIRDTEAAWMQIIRLRELGFRTIVDDFGSGASALGILQMLSADALKIGRAFIHRDLPGKRAQAVLGHVIRLAGDLGMRVICEGVENAEQAAIIRKLGCLTAQGFFYARPEAPHEFEARLALRTS